VEHVRCDRCKVVLYRTDGFRLLGPSEKDLDAMTIKPISIELGRRLRLIFCSKSCFLQWVLNTPEDSLKCGGYPMTL